MKREIRRRMAASVMQRPQNRRYEKANRLDDLVEMAQKKRKRRERGTRGFTTMFPVPAGAASKRVASYTMDGKLSGRVGVRKNDLATKGVVGEEVSSIGSQRTSIPMHERIEILLLAVCVTYSVVVEIGEDLGYWSKKLSFAVAVALLFVIHRLDAGSSAYYLDPESWQGAFRFATAFGWALTMFSVAKASTVYNFVFRTGVGAITFAARHEALPRLVDAAMRWKRAAFQHREAKL